MGQEINAYRVWSEYLKKRGHLQDLGLDWRIILKWILKKQDGTKQIGFMWCRRRASGGVL
jgi:hypothetical protein